MERDSKIVTEYAYKKICQQFLKSRNVVFSMVNDIEAETIQHSSIIKTTKNICSCAFFTSMGLPCAHIFAFLEKVNEQIFQPDLILERYFLEKNLFAGDFEYTLNAEQPSTSQVHLLRTSNPSAKMTHVRKFQIASKELNKIGELLASKPQSEFEQLLKTVEDFRKVIERGQLPGKIALSF